MIEKLGESPNQGRAFDASLKDQSKAFHCSHHKLFTQTRLTHSYLIKRKCNKTEENRNVRWKT